MFIIIGYSFNISMMRDMDNRFDLRQSSFDWPYDPNDCSHSDCSIPGP